MLAVAVLLLSVQISPARATGNAEDGARLFRACSACHSMTSGRHMTGPSLAGVWGRKAGTAPGFMRYSEALKSSGVIWNAETLDAWLTDPRSFIPNNRMTFPGIDDATARADLIAYLQTASSQPQAEGEGMMGGMMGGMSGAVQSLKNVAPGQQVTAIRYCGDTYNITTKSGEVLQFWERNLRFKTDSSDTGPLKGAPALVRAGMMGDRASVIFAAPDEISALIEAKC
jgi:cytochrome c